MMASSFFRRSTKQPDSWAVAIGYMGFAAARLEGQLQTKHTGLAGVIIHPDSGQGLAPARDQLSAVFRSSPSTTGIRVDIQDDDVGSQWLVLREISLKGLVRDMQAIGEELIANDLGHRIVAAIFPFTWHDTINDIVVRQYWIYQRRIGRYTPFVPQGLADEHRRDQSLEVRMEKALRRDLPTEQKVTEWYPIWGMPI